MSETREYFLLVCLHCTQDAGDPLVMPFDTFAERRRWWQGHRSATGHTWAWGNREGEQPQPHEVARQARWALVQEAKYAPSRMEGEELSRLVKALNELDPPAPTDIEHEMRD